MSSPKGRLKCSTSSVDAVAVFRRDRPSTETMYRRGVERWAARDLEAAVELFEAALDARSRPEDDGWWFSASRARAQVALEQDDLETARRHLAPMPLDPVGNAQQYGQRAHLALAEGNIEAATTAVSLAIASLADQSDRDVGSLMNGAIALMWCGEVLIELGYGAEAGRLAELARLRIDAAGIRDSILEGGLSLVESAGARLTGDPRAAALLAAIDHSLSPDFGFQITREQARLAWQAGDRDTALVLYREAAEQCLSLAYTAQTRRIQTESETGPPPNRVDPLPVEEWAGRQANEAAEAHQPYAVVAHLNVDRPLQDYLDLEVDVGDLLGANRHLGYVDGIGTDGTTFDLFLDGDDPAAL